MGGTRPWLVLAGGGTGGHLYPGLALADAIRSRAPDIEVTVFGTARAIDRQVVGPRGFELVEQAVRPMPSRPWGWPGFVLAWRRSVRAARVRFAARRPEVVLGLGGFGAAPAIVAASRLGVRTVLFNPDAEPGRANRRLARYVDEIFVQWEETAGSFAGCGARVVVTGCPVRADILSADRESGLRAFGLELGKRTLLITGASQGARSINHACAALGEFWRLVRGWQIVHLTGSGDESGARDAYAAAGIEARVLEYTEQMGLALSVADLVLSRAGASTLAELSARGVPSVLLPYPFDRRQHQRANAAVLERAGAAIRVDDAVDPKTNAERLRGVLSEVMLSDERRRAMAEAARRIGRPDAAERMADELLSGLAEARAGGTARTFG